MPDFPAFASPSQACVVGTQQLLAIEHVNLAALNVTTGAWPTANLAILVPMPLAYPLLLTQMFVWNGGTVSGNIDVGVYSREGKLVVSKGTTTQTGTSVAQIFDLTDTLLNPALYYLAVALDNTTGIIDHSAPTAINARMLGVLAVSTAFPLPATVTFEALTQAYVPSVHVTTQTVI